MNRDLIMQLAQRYDSFYLYDEAEIDRAVSRLQAAFPGIGFLYSVKNNPNPAVVRAVLGRGLGVDAASLAEVKAGVRCGLDQRMIQYSAPGKPQADLEAALELCTLVADSAGEADRIGQAARDRGMTAGVGLRINPDFSYAGPGGAASKFGIDQGLALASLAGWEAAGGLRVAGLHVHLRSQELDHRVLEGYYRRYMAMAEEFVQALGRPLEFLNMGSGIGIPYLPGDRPVDVAALGAAAAELAAALHQKYPQTRVYIETGRYAAGRAGVYAAKVLDVKQSHGKTFAVLCNTLNGMIRPCLEQLVLGSGGAAAPSCEPLYGGPGCFPLTVLQGGPGTEPVTLVGNLCTGADLVARDVLLPRLHPGSLVVMENAGSYAAALSSMQFSSQTPPAQVFAALDGTLTEFAPAAPDIL